jgi:putative GTP pyrophosphokinase
MVMKHAELDALLAKFHEEMPAYEELAKFVAFVLGDLLVSKGFGVFVTQRTKDPDELRKKALRKRYKNPYEEITDKAGARVIVKYSDYVSPVVSIVQDHFVCHGEPEDTGARLQDDQFSYRGVHLLVSVPDLWSDRVSSAVLGKICEVQIQTQLQSAWANVSHPYLYKPDSPIPAHARRKLYRLAALAEVFDDEVQYVREMTVGIQGAYEMRLLGKLEPMFHRFSLRPSFDRELSLDVLEAISSMFPTSQDQQQIVEEVIEFANQREDKLKELYDRYSNDDDASPMLFQPEAILIFFLIENQRGGLRNAWAQHYPLNFLEDLATAWGKSI